MRVVTRFVLSAVLVAAGCSATPPSVPPSVPPPRDPNEALYVENRGGPDLLLVVGAAPEVRVPCGASFALRPGEVGLADLPWPVEVRRASSGEVMLAEQVTVLPRWLVQIGNDSPGISSNAVLGPTTTCPPSG